MESRELFLLTHPVWDVTWYICYKWYIIIFLLTHHVWDVTRFGKLQNLPLLYFYSHIPCGMWQEKPVLEEPKEEISTHTSRVGCDFPGCRRYVSLSYFYSHIPCGMWHVSASLLSSRRKFLLTHPVWDVTEYCRVPFPIINFYSHIPCGMWLGYTYTMGCTGNFYSHIPCGMWRLWDGNKSGGF